MPSFGKRSSGRLATCDKRLITLFNEVVKHYDCSIIEGHRSADRQKELVADGKSRVIHSLHNRQPSMAVDVIPWPFKPSDWNNLKRFYHFQGFVKGICTGMQRDGRLDGSFELRCGLDWDGDNDLDDQSFLDGPHFEIRLFSEPIG